MKQYQQISIAAIPTLAVLMCLSPRTVVLTFLLFGNGHVLTAYWYQFRTGKMDERYALRFFLSILVIGLFLLVTHASLPLLTFATAVVFVAHFVLDEIHLLQTRVEPFLVFAILPVSLMYVVPLSDKLLGTSLSGYAVVGSLVCAGVYTAGTLLRRQVSYGGLWMLLLGMILVSVTFYDISAEKLLATVILFHYARWLVFYGDKYWRTPRFAPYLRDVFLIQGLVGVLFLCYAFAFGAPHTLLAIFFTETGFYVLTLLHVFSSTRTADYGGIYRLISEAFSGGSS